MGILDRPEGGDISTYRAYNTPEAQAERDQALTGAQAEAQIHGNEQAGVQEAVRATDEDNKS